MNLTRRSFLAAAAAAVGGGLVSCGTGASRLPDDPFNLGVASGDPSADGFVLWTRLALRPLEIGGGMAPETVKVLWEVAEDEQFSHGVRSGDAAALPELAHSVHV